MKSLLGIYVTSDLVVGRQSWHIAGRCGVCSQPVCCCHQWLMMLPAFHNYVIHHFLALTGTNTPASRHTLISGPLSKQLRIKTFINFLFYLEGIFAVIVGIWLMLTIQTLRCSLLTEWGHIPHCDLTITDKQSLLAGLAWTVNIWQQQCEGTNLTFSCFQHLFS